jgi:endonuclease G, mitochondrial
VTFAYLSDAMLMEVRTAVMDLGFNNDADLVALAAGISRPFVGGALIGASPNAKLMTFTARMNETKNLLSGEVPLSKWLNNAILLARGMPQELIFREALQALEPDGLPPSAVAPDVSATPRSSGGSLEIKVGEDDTLGVAFLVQGARAARSVAKLRVHRHFAGQPAFVVGGAPDWGLGTGWLIAPVLLITNRHVINARTSAEAAASDADFALQAASLEADFDYLDVNAAPTTIPAPTLAAADEVLDYAVLRLDAVGNDRAALRLRANPLTKPAASPLRERVNVLQHPNGDPMRLGFRNNFVVTGTAERLSYLTDTSGGSSGSPICDDAWQVAGLHRGWATITGEPVKVWDTSVRQENYATPIAAILAHLQAEHPDLHAEIMSGQAAIDD